MSGSANFTFLKQHDARLVQLATFAERYATSDPQAALTKLRSFAETLARRIAAQHALHRDHRDSLDEVLRRLGFERVLPRSVADIFHMLRRWGNAAVHAGDGTTPDALAALKYAHQLAIWFHRTYGSQPDFNPGPYQTPVSVAAVEEALRREIHALRQQASASEAGAAEARALAETAAMRQAELEQQRAKDAEEKAAWLRRLEETEIERAKLAAALARLQTDAVSAPAGSLKKLIEHGEEAANKLSLDESETRQLIDEQLRDRGWEADTAKLRYASGARPAKGRNMAIAEWPTASGPADYALFVGTRLIGVVEAKRKRKNVSTAIDQAQRYSEGFSIAPDFTFVGGPWGSYLVPFVFAANGRPYLRQLQTESGIWFRDVRRASNHRRALVDWPTPDGLIGQLEIDTGAADAELSQTPFDFGFPLRPYQEKAIRAVEAKLAEGRHELLVAMATGTGKTKLAIAMLYRLLTAKRFRRICFVVDRSALGTQTAGEFSTTKVVTGKAFAEIFGLKGMDATTPEADTRVHICTIQGLVKRVLYADVGEAPPVDQYDLLVIDECHRGYLLDREMTDSELAFRNEDDYISKYRRVLDYFDAVKIGLTATPALHTTEIFGEPVYRYSYREAVIDGYLIDHEPPIRIETALARDGIGFSEGEQVEYYAPSTGTINTAVLPDALDFEVEAFNKQVITRNFNRAVAEELARHIDPALPDKTLVFAVSDAHADMVVDEIKAAFAKAYGAIDDSAVRKITGSVDRVQTLIRSFRNDADPKIAVTVDLLTTGIDVPKITNLVFLRRVNSRILYEQMVGRATRQCPEIGKEVFRIFDAVDLYPHLQALVDMRPVVVNPTATFAQLIAELTAATDAAHRDDVREQLVVRLRRQLRRMADEAKQQFEAIAGETPEALLRRLLTMDASAAANWFRDRTALGPVLDWQSSDAGAPRALPISYHADEVVAVTRGYGSAERPEDFLDSFAAFVRDNTNTIAALKLVVTRPRDLTRADLRELRLALDRRGFSEANLKRAWAEAKNEDIAASIIGFVRQAAIGDPLVPFADRVRAALRKILASRTWTDPQRRWLTRIGEQIEREIVVDRDALDRDPFAKDGGFSRLNKVFGGELATILAGVNEEIWGRTG
jgi:type I restriction enzyme R subunit